MLRLGLIALLVTAACGGDDTPNPPPKKPGAPTAPGAAGTGPGGKGTPLPDRTKIEDIVKCEIPDKPTDPKDGKCDPKAPECPPRTYCLPVGQGYFCEACPERDGIRHAFKERDFALEQNRDPFQSFLLPQLSPTVGKSDNVVPIDPTKKCLKADQMVATTYSYSELKLVGIVAQGTQRKVLMMGGPLGYIIKRGDCVGKEKAVVKDIGSGYITFLVDQDPTGAQRNANEYSVQLHPNQLAISSQPTEQPLTPKAVEPPIAPPPNLPPKPGSGAGSAQGASAGSGSAAPPVAVPVVPPPKR